MLSVSALVISGIGNLMSFRSGGYVNSYSWDTALNIWSLQNVTNLNTDTSWIVSESLGISGDGQYMAASVRLSGKGGIEIYKRVVVPIIVSGQSFTGKVGAAFTSASPTLDDAWGVPSVTSWSATGLPAGLSLNTTTGAVTGTPTTKGSFTASFTATGGDVTSAASSVAFTIVEGAPLITASQTASGTVGTAFSKTFSLTDSANRPVTSWAATGLPSWATLNTATGAITGTPQDTGSTTISLTATGPGGTSGATTATISIAVGPPIIVSGQSFTGKVGVAFFQTPASTGVITSWALASGNSLPAGLSLNTTTGAITGTPTAKGSFTVSFTVTGGGGASVAGVAFTITDGVPIIAVSQVLRGGVRRVFSMVPSLTDAANRAVLDWRAVGLPAWATINTSTGDISGYPEIVGDAKFTLTVTGPGGSDSKVLGISVEDLAVILYKPGFDVEGHANDIILRERRFIFARWTGKGLIPPGMNWAGTDEGLRIWGAPYSEGIWEAEFEGPYPPNFESDLTSGGSSEPPLQLDAGDLPGEIVVERFSLRFKVEEQAGYTYGQVLKELFTNPSVEQTARRVTWAGTTCIGARPLSGAFLESGEARGVNLNESFGFSSVASNLAEQINGSELATAIVGQGVLGVEIQVTALAFGALVVAASSTNQSGVETRIATQGSTTVKQVAVITLTGQFRGGVVYSVGIGDKVYTTTTQAPSKAGLWFYAAPSNVGDAEGSTARCLRNSDLREEDYAAGDWQFSLPAVIERSQEGCLLTAGVAGSALLDGVRRTVAINSVIPL